MRRDQRSALGEASARSFLLRTGFQLAALWPELFDLDPVRIDVEQEIGSAESTANVIGARVERISASPFHQKIFRIVQRVRQTRGSLVGLNIGEWTVDPRLIELDDLQEMALFAPARTLLRLRPKARIVILVDALDELVFGQNGQTLMAWLSDCPQLPENLRIVLSSRPTHGQLVTFISKRAASLSLLPLRADDNRVRADVKSYSEALVRAPEIVGVLRNAERNVETFLAELLDRADGNIGYVAALGRAFDHSVADPAKHMMFASLLRLDRLPSEIGDLFAFFLHLIQHGPGAGSIKISNSAGGRSVFVNAWTELYHPILSVLALALQPLTLDQIYGLTDTLASRIQVAEAVGWLEQFLDRIGGGYRLYHATFAEFLTASATRAEPDASELWVNPHAEHRRLCRTMEEAGSSESIWCDAQEARVQGRREYARLHYLTHLYLADEFERLWDVIEEGSYGRGKIEYDPSTHLFARDLDLAIRAIQTRWKSEVIAAKELIRLWKFKLLRVTLTGFADHIPPAGYAALTMVGRHHEASNLAELITDPERSALAFGSIAEVLAEEEENSGQATTHLCTGFEAAARVHDAARRYALLENLLRSGVPLANTCGCAAIVSATSALAHGLPSIRDQAQALAMIVNWLINAGRRAEALEIRDEIRSLHKLTEDPKQAQYLIYIDAILTANIGDLEDSRVVAAALGNPATRAEALTRLVFRALAAGAEQVVAVVLEELAAIRTNIPAGRERAWVDIWLAEIAAVQGNTKSADELVAEAHEQLSPISGFLFNGSALNALARVARDAGLVARHKAVVEAMRDAALAALPAAHTKGDDPMLFSIALESNDAARILANVGAWEQALEVARRIPVHNCRDAFEAVISYLIEAKEFDHAIAVSDELVALEKRASMMFSFKLRLEGRFADDEGSNDKFAAIAAGLAEEGQWQRALEFAENLAGVSRNEALSHIAILRYQSGEHDEAANLMTRMKREMRLADTMSLRDQALEKIGEFCILGRKWSRAQEIAGEIRRPESCAQFKLRIIEALVGDGLLEEAEALCSSIEVPASYTEGLLMIARGLGAMDRRACGRAFDDAIWDNLKRARTAAIKETNKERSATALRSVALAFSELSVGEADDPRTTMQEALTALQALPTYPMDGGWGKTAEACARLKYWDWALKIASGLIDHDRPFDGCRALLDLANVAADQDDNGRAASLLMQAESNASRMQVLPLRKGFLRSVSDGYAQIGKLEEARRLDRAAGNGSAARIRVALTLVKDGRLEEALVEIDNFLAEPLDDSYLPADLIQALLGSGQTEPARRLAAAIQDPKQRAQQLEVIARHFVAARKHAQALELISREPWLADGWPSAENVARVLAEAGEMRALDRLIRDRWDEVRTQEELLDRIQLAEPLVRRDADTGPMMHDSYRWVESVLVMPS